jgi:hypothetical protein
MFASDICHEIDQLIDCNHFLRPSVDRTGEARPHQPHGAFQALVDLEEQAVCSPSPQISMSSPLQAIATLRQMAAGAFSRPPTQVPSGPKIL